MAPVPIEGLPATMSAWSHSVAGRPEKVLALRRDVKTPGMDSTEHVIVQVSHAALNIGSSIIMQMCPSFLRTKPCIPEMDFAGKVVAVRGFQGKKGRLREGMLVFGSVPVPAHLKGAGTLAEYVNVDGELVMEMPEGAKPEEVAGLGVAGCTALTLIEKAQLKEGMKVLLNAAGGGIGSLALQMVRDKIGKTGKIVAICSTNKMDLVKKLGADEVVDYTQYSPVVDYLKTTYGTEPFDVVIDAYGIEEIFLHSPGYLTPGGLFVTVGVAFDKIGLGGMMYSVSRMMWNALCPRFLGGIPRTYVQVTGLANHRQMQILKDMYSEGKLKGVVDSCWAMTDAQKAYDRLLGKGVKGKVIVEVQGLPASGSA